MKKELIIFTVVVAIIIVGYNVKKRMDDKNALNA